MQCFAEERQALLEAALGDPSKSAAAKLIAGLALNEAQKEQLRAVIDAVLTDAYYTVLLALDGEAALGDRQEAYKLLAEDGTNLTEDGMIEVHAWEYFRGPKKA